MENPSVIGIDIAKRSFELCGMTQKGKVVLLKKLVREDLLEFLGTLPRGIVVALEACGGAHHLGRLLEGAGFIVCLIPPQYVKPYVKRHKNDRVDAQAIAEAASREEQHFEPVKTVEQQELQHLHCVREQQLKRRTALINQLHGMLLEYGVVLSRSRKALREIFARLEQLPLLAQLLVRELYGELEHIEARLKVVDERMAQIAKAHPECARLERIGGVGPVIATAVLAKVTAPSAYRSGRHFSAALGIVPNQHSTGGKARLGAISKRGDRYLRKLLVHGSRSLMYRAHLKSDPLSRWVTQLKERRGWNRACVALANKQARIIWAVLRYGEEFDAQRACRS